jgi:hypothetical protein
VNLSRELCSDSFVKDGLIIGCHVVCLTLVRRKCPKGIIFITFLGSYDRFVDHDQSGALIRGCVGPSNAQPCKIEVGTGVIL